MRRSATTFIDGKAWIQRHVRDSYVKQATKEDLRARSAFKLVDIQKSSKLIKKTDFVIDLGAAPGSSKVN